MAAKKINKNMKFEEALAELEAAVEKLESGTCRWKRPLKNSRKARN